MNGEDLFTRLQRDATAIFTEESLRSRLAGGQRLVIKLGADPSRPDLHLGHSVVLRKLRDFQALGHQIVFVIGDFTAMIGDPTGLSKARQPLSLEETKANGRSYFEQVGKILDLSKTRVVNNAQWLSPLNTADLLALASKYTVARILERDDFADRYSHQQPIGLQELFYPLLQGYDSVVLKADIEVGGSDQTFNLLVGRELQRDYGQIPQDVITFPLLIGLDGSQKMSKSLDNAIGITDASEVMFEKAMRVPDAILADYFRLTTDVPATQYQMLIRQDIYEAHLEYARTIVNMYHCHDDMIISEKHYRAIAAGETPESLETRYIQGSQIMIIELLRIVGYARSNSEARRLIGEGSVRINDQTVSDCFLCIKEGPPLIIRKGRNRLIRVVFQAGEEKKEPKSALPVDECD